jgi:hypothetical protein
MTKSKKDTKPKDQYYSYKKQSAVLYQKLFEAMMRLERIKAIHFEQFGICKQCKEIYPCSTRLLCGNHD